jgi:phage terminase large subunit-like protein
VLNAASIETSRGIRLSKEKQSLKIDGAVALSFAVVAAEQTGKPLDLEELRNYELKGDVLGIRAS